MTLLRRIELGLTTYGDAQQLLVSIGEMEAVLCVAINAIQDPDLAGQLMRVQQRVQEVLHEDDH